MSFYPKDSNVQDRYLKVERLVIPIRVTHNASSASVVLASDESSILYMQSQGVNQITAQDSVSAAEFANQTTSDSSGQLNILVELNEVAKKVMKAELKGRQNGTAYTIILDQGSVVVDGSPSGVSTTGALMLYVSSSVNFSSTDLDACLDVSYVLADGR